MSKFSHDAAADDDDEVFFENSRAKKGILSFFFSKMDFIHKMK